MRSIGLLAAVLALGACVDAAPPFETSSPAPAGANASSAAEQAATLYPGFDANAAARCIQENATEGELALMAVGDMQAQAETAQAVLGRPATQTCLARNNVTLPGASL
jgi:hypothetical protein